MTKEDYIIRVMDIARTKGYSIASNRSGQMQIDFGHKRLHSGHLVKLYPEILDLDANISALIERVAPGRPCSHRPMKEIMRQLSEQRIS